MKLGVLKETFPGERRVAVVPALSLALGKAGLEVLVEAGAGDAAGFSDAEYAAHRARIVGNREEVWREADVIAQVRGVTAHDRLLQDHLLLIRREQTVIGLADALQPGGAARVRRVAETGARLLALEFMPRITRAQRMDVLSSQATVAGYQAALLAAEQLPRMMPMMMTAAGTVAAARVFVIGAGVAGLQAIATSRRLGAIVQAYDVRPAVKEQVESLGARFVQIDLPSELAEGSGGYARAMGEDFYRRQREMLADVVAGSDVVITTAAVPGAAPPVLVTGEMVRAMPRGSVIVDLAARHGVTGGNCDLTQPDQQVIVPANAAVVLGPTNLPSAVPHTASEMFARNVLAFVQHLIKDGRLQIDLDDEIVRGTLLTQDGAVVHERFKNEVPL